MVTSRMGRVSRNFTQALRYVRNSWSRPAWGV